MYQIIDKKLEIEGLINSYNIYIEFLEIDTTFGVYILEDESFIELNYILSTLLKHGIYHIDGNQIITDVFDKFSLMPYKFPGTGDMYTVTKTYLMELYKKKNKEEEMKMIFKEKTGIDLDEFKKYLNK